MISIHKKDYGAQPGSLSQQFTEIREERVSLGIRGQGEQGKKEYTKPQGLEVRLYLEGFGSWK